MYFKDFSPCTISRSSMKALQSIDWKTYGLNLRGTVEQDGVTLLEWENLPTDTHIDIVLHVYHKQYPALDRSFLSLSETVKSVLHSFFLYIYFILLSDVSLDFVYIIYLWVKWRSSSSYSENFQDLEYHEQFAFTR